MTKDIERNWAKWEENIAPVLAAAEEETKSNQKNRQTLKMYEEDPDEVIKIHVSEPFERAKPPAKPLKNSEPMFSHLPPDHPYNKGMGLAELPKEQ